MKVIGLTGGIGSGKSTVAHLLTEMYGFTVLDADQAARDVVYAGSPTLNALAVAFGPVILQADGSLNRAALRRQMVNDPEVRSSLNAITHPAIRERLAEQLAELKAQGHTHAVVEAALMVETGTYKNYPEVLVVSCARATQVKRVMARDITTADQAEALIDAQMPLAQKETVATHLIRNEGSLDELRAAVAALWPAKLTKAAPAVEARP